MSQHLILTPRDPLVVRDGRPFGNASGHRMKSLDWPYPSVLAGSLRTLLGKLAGGFSDEIVAGLKRIEIAGPLPLLNHELYFPAPRDILVYEEDGVRRHMRLWPAQYTGGCDLPDGLAPVAVTKDVKPADVPAYWSSNRMAAWLCGESPTILPPTLEEAAPGTGYLKAPDKDERTHAAIDMNTGAAADGMLFTTVGLDMTEGLQIAARVDANDDWTTHLNRLGGLYPFGGERRLVHWQRDDNTSWQCPSELQATLSESGTRLIRLILATPAIFDQGWRPGWLNAHWQGSPPCHPGITLKLISACVDRWKPISGWSLEKGRWGPKPVRRLVPAGSVYFFEVEKGDPATLADDACWLRSICDTEQDRRDGFGLALWGIWKQAEGKIQ